jgi:imidazolonepropionase-like amidohydrolase
MLGMRRLLLVGLAALFGSACQAQDQRPINLAAHAHSGPVAIVGVNLIAMTSERVVPDQTVITENGRIVYVGPSAHVPIPSTATRIDGRGRYLIPGLADMHVHIQYQEELLPYLANGFTTVLNMRGAPSHLVWREEIAAGRMIGPTLYTAGPTLNGLPRMHRLNIIVLTPDQASYAVARQRALGYDYVKVYNNIPAPAYNAILAAGRENGIAIIGHWVRSAGPQLLKLGQKNVAHLEEFYYGYFDSKPDDSKLDMAARETARNGVTVTTTLIAIRNIIKLPNGTDDFLSQPEAKFVPPPVLEQWDTNSFRGLKADFIEKNQVMYAFLKKIAKSMQDGHVRLMLGTDADFPSLVGGFASQDELGILVEAGLTPYEALVAATRSPGEFVAETLPGSEPFGTIEVGTRADLVLLDDNPLQNIANTKKRVGVMARGVWYSQRELDDMLEDTAASFFGWR